MTPLQKWAQHMNNLVENRTAGASVGTVAVVGLTAAMAAGQAQWPVIEKPIYSTQRAMALFAYSVAPSYISPVVIAEGRHEGRGIPGACWSAEHPV